MEYFERFLYIQEMLKKVLVICGFFLEYSEIIGIWFMLNLEAVQNTQESIVNIHFFLKSGHP